MRSERRIKRDYPFIIGLTGSIGMGKSTVADMFRRLGVPVLDSDKVVHQLLGPKGAAVEKVAELFAGSRVHDHIDRKALGKLVFGNAKKLKLLESIIHPLVWKAQTRFIRAARRRGKKTVVLDIPLLFETGAQKRCNTVLVVTAPPFIQKQRVLPRNNMTPEKFARILCLQMPDRQKRAHADLIIHTGQGKAWSFRQVKASLHILQAHLQ